MSVANNHKLVALLRSGKVTLSTIEKIERFVEAERARREEAA